MSPRYPVYVISKGRHDCCLTANVLLEDKTPFRIVIEAQEKDLYAVKYSEEQLLILPFSNLGQGSIPARNWVWEHAKASGHKRHWILDDNIHSMQRRWKAKRFYCNASIALGATEDFVDRYENVAIGGLNYAMFAPDKQKTPPFVLNAHVYSCLLILNELPHRWRGRYNEDTDLCLQVLADKWCIIQLNAFLIQKIATGVMKGGNATSLYKGDGRLKMARSLQRMWPNVVTTGRRFQRPQHIIRNGWRKFDTPLIRRKDIDFDNLKPNEYGMKLKTIRPIKSKRLKKMVREYGSVGK